MVRCFGETGHKVTLIVYGQTESYVARSVYVEESYITLTAFEALQELESICNKDEIKPVVITCPDEISSMMDIRYDDLKHKCIFFNAQEAGRITHFMDKQVQLELAEKCGFKVPKSQETFPNSVEKTIITYPCFIKPKESIYGGKNLAKCDNKWQLDKALLKYSNKHKILIQDYIKKGYEIVILGLSVNGKLFLPGFVKKHREFRGGTTYSTVYPISELEYSLVDCCRKLLININYEGLWGIECIKNSTGYWFLELNLRNDATSYALSVAGVNLPYAYYKSMSGYDISEIVETPVRKVNAMVEFEDFNYVIKCKLSPCAWIKQLKQSECRYVYSEKDPEPYYQHKKDYLKFLRKRILHF